LRLGISVEEAQALFDEGERLALKSGDIGARTILLSLYGGVIGMSEGDVREWARLARQTIELADECGDPALYVAVATPASLALYCVGEHRAAIAICDRAIELADGDPTVGDGIILGCPYAQCHHVKGWYLAELGEFEQARRVMEQERAIGREQGDVEVVGWSHLSSTFLAYLLGEPEGALAHAQQSLEIAERIGYAINRAWAWLCLGLAEQMQGEWGRAIEAVERAQAIARERRVGVELDGWRLALLSESYLRLGEVARARALAGEGLEIARARGNAWNERHASLALARALLRAPGPAARAEIEAALARALELARETGAKAFEPLVHVELAELAHQSGDREGREREFSEAHRLFTEIGATGHAERLSAELALWAS
jgi:tetratricopeptide (TPR) repeat protein